MDIRRTQMEPILAECRATKDKQILNLTGKLCDELPAEINMFDWLTVVILKDTKIQYLHNLPPNTAILNAVNCKIKTLERDMPSKLKALILTNNFINYIDVFKLPASLEILKLNDNVLEDADVKSIFLRTDMYLQHLDISKNRKLTNLGFDICHTLSILNSLKELHMSDNTIEKIELLPFNLEVLIAKNSGIKTISSFPDSLLEIDLSNNKLRRIPNIPNHLKKLLLTNNNLTSFPDHQIPETICTLDISNNELGDTHEIEKAVKKINLVSRTPVIFLFQRNTINKNRATNSHHNEQKSGEGSWYDTDDNNQTQHNKAQSYHYSSRVGGHQRSQTMHGHSLQTKYDRTSIVVPNWKSNRHKLHTISHKSEIVV